MKKTVKGVALIIAVIIFCFSLCGCVDIDDMKKSQAFITDTGVVFNGNEYYPLPESDRMQFFTTEYNPVYITEKDVPVLLSSFMGSECILSDDGKFLYSESETIRYCRSDVYESVLSRINSGYVHEGYFYSYYDFKNDKAKYYRLTEKDEAAIKALITSTTPEKLPDVADIDYDYYIELNSCSDDMIFWEYAYEFYIKGEKYYLADINSSEKTLLYTVPDNLLTDFKRIAKEYVKSEEEWFNNMD